VIVLVLAVVNMLQIVIIVIVIIVVICNSNSISNSSSILYFGENSILSRRCVYHKSVKTDEENSIYQLTWYNMPEGWNLSAALV